MEKGIHLKCHNCRREIGDFTAFCTYCGASTGNQPAESSQITDPGKTDEPAEALPGYSEPFEQTGREAPPPLYNVNRQENPQIDLIPEHNALRLHLSRLRGRVHERNELA